MVKLVDQDKPVYVFTGYILPAISKEPEKTLKVRLSPDFTVTVPTKMHEFFSFIATPRYKEDIYVAIANSCGNISDVDRMFATDLFRIVPPGQNDLSLDALSDLKLIPMGYKVERGKSNSPGSTVYVGHSEDATSVWPISSLLASVLWDKADEDFPASVRRAGVESGLRSDVAIRMALSDLDGLLGHGLARWENLSEPNETVQRQALSGVAVSEETPARPISRIKNFLLSKYPAK